MNAFFRRLFVGCWKSHGDLIRTRDEDGHLILKCVDCQTERPFFAEEVVRGPAHQASEVLGSPTGKAKILRATLHPSVIRFSDQRGDDRGV